jgi:hypothetical protein
MSVVLRCPNCGTTRAAPGECEACHEAEARYFCTNHAPGVWLNASTCPTCGAQFGVPERVAVLPATTPAVRKRPPPPPARVPAPEVYARSERPRIVMDEAPEPGIPELAPWQGMLKAIVRARLATRERERLPRGPSAGGCLRRLLVVFLVLALLLVGALFLFGRAVMQGLQPY